LLLKKAQVAFSASFWLRYCLHPSTVNVETPNSNYSRRDIHRLLNLIFRGMEFFHSEYISNIWANKSTLRFINPL